MTATWLLRLAKWARHPPSWGRVKLVVGVVLLCVLLFAVESFFGWPEVLTPQKIRP